jgi:copper chaperone NosL
MTSRTRFLLVIGFLIGLAALRLPLWEVRLGAPQYPEGLGLRIHAHTVTGIKEHDLDNINGLNHYIGMKPITPEAIPELRYMPWLIGWLIAFALLGAVGLWDFWRWEYDYGHNLDMEKAIIIVPDMTYQPPLIGSKQLLNFTATAWPGLGTIALGISFLTGAGVWFVTRPKRAA